MPKSGRAIVIRKRDGDNAEDGTVTETGERIFFSQEHLLRALMNSHTNKNKHNINALKDQKVASLVSYSVLERFGMQADVNEDGEITNAEILSLKAGARHGGNALNFATAALTNRAKMVSFAAWFARAPYIGKIGKIGKIHFFFSCSVLYFLLLLFAFLLCALTVTPPPGGLITAS